MAEGTEQKRYVPPPPEPELAIRTMETDIKSLKQSGGEAPSPEFLNLQYKVKEQAKEGEELINRGGVSGIKGYSGPEKGIFEPGATVRVTPSVINQVKPEIVEPVSARKSGILKTIFTIIMILIGCAVLGFGAYYVMITYFV